MHQVLESRLLLTGIDPRGAIFPVGPYADAGALDYPAIAMDGDGDLLAVWADLDGQTGLYGQFLSASGQVRGPAIQLVELAPETIVEDFAVAREPDGDFAVAWLVNDAALATSRVLVQRFEAGAESVGQPVEVAAASFFTAELIVDLALAADADGNLLVAWTLHSVLDNQVSFWAQRIGPDAQDLWAQDALLASTSQVQYYHCSLAGDAAGNFALTWAAEDGLWFQRFAGTGLPADTPVHAAVTPDPMAPAAEPGIAMTSAGAFTLAWWSGAAGNEVRARQYSSTGAPLGEWTTLGLARPDAWTGRLSLACDADGDLSAAWTELGTARQAFVQRATSALAPSGAAVRLYQGDADATFTPPAVAANAAGARATVWISDRDGAGDILAILDDASGASGLTVRRLVAGTGELYPLEAAVAIDPAGRILLAWTESDVIAGAARLVRRLFNADGSPAGEARTIAQASGEGLELWSPSAAFAPDGTFAVTWGRRDATTSAIWGWRSDLAGRELLAARSLQTAATGVTLLRSALTIQSNGYLRLVWQERQDGADRIVTRPFTVAGKIAAASLTLAVNTPDVSVSDPAIAAATGGAMLVLWHTGGQTVSAQRLTAVGELSGAAAPLITLSDGWQFSGLALSVEGAGWRLTYRQRDAVRQAFDLMERRLLSDASPDGAPRIVLQSLADQRLAPSVALSDEGVAFLVWTRDANLAGGVYLSVLNADGTTRGLTRELTEAFGPSARELIIAAGAGPTFVALWIDDAAGAMVAQRFDADGRQVGPRLTVLDLAGGTDLLPARHEVDIDAEGGVLAVWDTAGADALHLRRFAADGTMDLEASILAPEGQWMSCPDVAADGAGGYALAWRQGNIVGGGASIRFQRFSPLGEGLGEPILVIEGEPVEGPNIVMDELDETMISWTEYVEAGASRALAVFYDASNRRLGRPQPLMGSADDRLVEALPAVAMNSLGDYVLAWPRQALNTRTELIERAVIARRFAPFVPGELEAPRVLSVMVNDDPSLSLSGVETHWQGIRTITVRFSEPVIFEASNVLVQAVSGVGGDPIGEIAPLAVAGSGTDTMILSFALMEVTQATIRVTLDADLGDGSAIMDRAANLLDGEPPEAGSQTGYLADAGLDLPSGNGEEGGDAVFYVTAMDDVGPQILSVVINDTPGMGPSALECRPTGVEKIVVHFSEPVYFQTGDVLIENLNHPEPIVPLSIDGSSTETMTILFSPNSVRERSLRITLASSVDPAGGLADYWANRLDGEPAPAGSEQGYLATPADLPSGDGAPGGPAVFYVSAYVPPRIVEVIADGVPGLDPAGVETGSEGIQSLTIRFSKPVQAGDGAICLETAAAIGGPASGTVSPLGAPAGNGTDTLTFSFAPGTLVNRILRVTLEDDPDDGPAVTDLFGTTLDGEAAGEQGYLTADNLPSGDDVPGGEGLFYVRAFIAPPRIVQVIVNDSPDLGLSSTAETPGGIRSIRVRFDQTVAFDPSDILVQTAQTIGGPAMETVIPLAIAGSGSDTILITFADDSVTDTVLRVTLDGQGLDGSAIADELGNLLDGQPPVGGSGLEYLAGETDLPSGDGEAGGSAVFYVAHRTVLVRGDLTGDGLVDARDIDALRQEIQSATHRPGFDLTGDNRVDELDFYRLLYGILRSCPADFNLDGQVSGRDLMIWQTGYPKTAGASWADGDADGDAMVSGRDMLIWQAWYGAGAGGLVGDVTADGLVNADDIDALTAEIRAGRHLSRYDVNRDGRVDQTDVDVLVYGVLGTTHGDFNLDGVVSGRDLMIWQANYPKLAGATWAGGDADGDGQVTGRDLMIWQANYHPAPAGGATLLPATMTLAAARELSQPGVTDVLAQPATTTTATSAARIRRAAPTNLELPGQSLLGRLRAARPRRQAYIVDLLQSGDATHILLVRQGKHG